MTEASQRGIRSVHVSILVNTCLAIINMKPIAAPIIGGMVPPKVHQVRFLIRTVRSGVVV